MNNIEFFLYSIKNTDELVDKLYSGYVEEKVIEPEKGKLNALTSANNIDCLKLFQNIYFVNSRGFIQLLKEFIDIRK